MVAGPCKVARAAQDCQEKKIAVVRPIVPKARIQYYSNAILGVCVFSSHSFWISSSLDVPAGVAQEEGHTGFLIHLLSAVRALIFLARRIQPFLSLVDREVAFCNRSPPVGRFFF